MPHWFLPLLALIALGAFLYFGFWRGLGDRPNPDGSAGSSGDMTGGAGGVGDITGGSHDSGAAGHH
ncbi:MAG: hypothetical protein AB1586_00610 [Pseudomonadota bacterium]|jgi:hypothetical protein